MSGKLRVSFKDKVLSKYSIRDRRKWPFVYAMAAIPVIQIALFFFYVNLSSFALAFTNNDGTLGLESFERVFKAFSIKEDSLGLNPLEMIGKSAISYLVANVISAPIALFTAYILTKHMIGSNVFRVIYYIPSIVAGTVLTGVMKEMYAYNGMVTKLLLNMGIDLSPMVLRNGLLGDKSTAFLTIQIQRFIFSIAGGSMIIASAFKRVPNEVFEAASLDGCGFFRETFQIAMPCIWATWSTLFLFGLCTVLTSDYGAYLYSNGSGNNGMVSVGFYLHRYQVAVSRAPTENTHLYGYISAFGMLITLATLPLVFGGRYVLSKIQDKVDY